MIKKTNISELVAKIKADQDSVSADSSHAATVANFEEKYGYRLTQEMQQFYSLLESAVLFENSFEILPVKEIQPATIAVYGHDDMVDLQLPSSWFAFSSQGASGDWIMIDLDPELPVNPVMDLNHESPENCAVIALSFSEFLSDALTFGKESSVYWLTGEKETYGEAKIQQAQLSSEGMRAAFASAEQQLEPELGPEKCKRNDCQRLHIPLSAMCKRHHVEMLNRSMQYPIDEYEYRPATCTYERQRPWFED